MANDSDLVVNIKLLVDSESRLNRIKKELNDLDNRKDDMNPYWGSSQIAEVMGDFVDNWEKYREKMLETVENVGKLVTSTIDGFTGLDSDLAKELRKAGKKK
ncbi:hypothetical protein [Streptomyces sp. DH10]|uniref:hypothetical protein n=1 Tax=Streptomyces sp. DH10 TaxID=3040121 RepID=UPI002441A245|nr:hypothetical protein [Streptomyces sp. DH10]MDG9708061.1 hypothetical protein [Streptomyces sp. DH10]